MRDYDILISISPNSNRFDILYEFTQTSQKLVDKILNSLNTIRELEAATN